MAAAVHWFDLDAFYAEVTRVLRPGGVLAVWTYHIGLVEPPFDRVFYRFYDEVLRPYFSPKVIVVNERYKALSLPGEPADPEELFHVTAQWNLEQVKSFIHGWSGAQKYREDTGQDPIDKIGEELSTVWGSPDTVHKLSWPIFMRASRV